MTSISRILSVLALSGLCHAWQAPGNRATVILQQSISKTCRVTQTVELVGHNQYASVVVTQTGEEIFSPQLSKESRLLLPSDLDKSLTKLARSSGFRIQTIKVGLDASPQVVRSEPDAQCPPTTEALKIAAQNRERRKREIQSKLHQPGVDGVTRPLPLNQEQQSTGAESTINPEIQSKASHAAIHKGPIVLAAVVDTDGSVQQVKVIRSVSRDLDDKVMNSVKKWKFNPATKSGLPVPVQINIEVNLRLY